MVSAYSTGFCSPMHPYISSLRVQYGRRKRRPFAVENIRDAVTLVPVCQLES